MGPGLTPHCDMDDALNHRFRGLDARDWNEWGAIAREDAGGVPHDATRACVRRVKTSHRGIGERKALRDLIAGAADQDYLDEICTLEGLERLELAWPLTASRLDGLRALKNLRHLKIESPRNVTDFTPLLGLPSLRTLIIENAKHMADIEWLADAHHLEVIGIEGSMWTMQKVPTLRPLAGLAGMRAFFATAVRLGEKNLFPLAECPALEYLSCARFAPRKEFEMLQNLKPDLVCCWFDAPTWETPAR
jgi:hypothetical protein